MGAAVATGKVSAPHPPTAAVTFFSGTPPHAASSDGGGRPPSVVAATADREHPHSQQRRRQRRRRRWASRGGGGWQRRRRGCRRGCRHTMATAGHWGGTRPGGFARVLVVGQVVACLGTQVDGAGGKCGGKAWLQRGCGVEFKTSGAAPLSIREGRASVRSGEGPAREGDPHSGVPPTSEGSPTSTACSVPRFFAYTVGRYVCTVIKVVSR